MELLNVRERAAFLQDRFDIGHRPFEFCSQFFFASLCIDSKKIINTLKKKLKKK